MSQIRLFNCDCMEAMKEMKDKQYDLAIVDPPYRNEDENNSNEWSRRVSKNGRVLFKSHKPNNHYFSELVRISKAQIIWGANNYGKEFKGFVVWDKRIRGCDNFHGLKLRQ